MQPARVITPDERKLAEQYAIAAREYSDSVVKLVQLLDTVPAEECRKQHGVVEQARQRSEDTRALFEQFASALGCGKG
jgi:hypothetical protein